VCDVSWIWARFPWGFVRYPGVPSGRALFSGNSLILVSSGSLELVLPAVPPGTLLFEGSGYALEAGCGRLALASCSDCQVLAVACGVTLPPRTRPRALGFARVTPRYHSVSVSAPRHLAYVRRAGPHVASTLPGQQRYLGAGVVSWSTHGVRWRRFAAELLSGPLPELVAVALGCLWEQGYRIGVVCELVCGPCPGCETSTVFHAWGCTSRSRC
jgi:hypothetical protein